jgi:hypothetical protein
MDAATGRAQPMGYETDACGDTKGTPVSRSQRAFAAAAGIAPVTLAGLALLRCGCVLSGWTLEIFTAIAYFVWIAATWESDK